MVHTGDVTAFGDDVDVLIPTCDRPEPLAITLTCLHAQAYRPARVILADQGERPCLDSAAVAAVVRVMRIAGIDVEVVRNLPRRGMAQQRQLLLDRATAPYVWYLDDDVLVEPDLLRRLLDAMLLTGCGYVGSFPNSPSAVTSTAPVDQLPPDVLMERWDGPVEPEVILPDSPEWGRYRLHFAANQYKRCVASGVDKENPILYRVAWLGACFLADAAKLREVGGFDFWPELPPAHSGEDVVAQLRLQARYGAAGLAPSGSWHQEVRTTRPGDEPDAPRVLDLARMLEDVTRLDRVG